jgi:RNA polymerase sigma-70 factor, ECF subfamily
MSSAEASLPLSDRSSGSPDGAAAGAGAESPAAGRAQAGPDADASPGDAVLVRAVQRGDEGAFETLVRRHLRAAHAAALALTGDPDDADDVCQDAFVSALEKIAQCRDPERFRAWLVRIVRNRAHDMRRRARSVKLGTETVANDESPFQFADRSELRGRLAVALDTLTELQRRVLLLHDFEGWRHAEISTELGISHVSSRFNLHVARRAMRARLKGMYGKE